MVEEKVEEKTSEEKDKEIKEIINKPIAEVDAMAKERGLTPGDYPNIEELAVAIEETPMEPGKPEGEEPEGGTSEGEKPEGEEPEGPEEKPE